MSDMTYRLIHPIKYKDMEWDELKFRRGNAGDMRSIAHITTDIERTLLLLSRLTGVPPNAIDLLELDDLNGAGDFLTHALGDSRRTGNS